MAKCGAEYGSVVGKYGEVWFEWVESMSIWKCGVVEGMDECGKE